eukprot:6210864-Pleurochrysis_carterae.AAC.2
MGGYNMQPIRAEAAHTCAREGHRAQMPEGQRFNLWCGRTPALVGGGSPSLKARLWQLRVEKGKRRAYHDAEIQDTGPLRLCRGAVEESSRYVGRHVGSGPSACRVERDLPVGTDAAVAAKLSGARVRGDCAPALPLLDAAVAPAERALVEPADSAEVAVAADGAQHRGGEAVEPRVLLRLGRAHHERAPAHERTARQTSSNKPRQGQTSSRMRNQLKKARPACLMRGARSR